MPPLILASASPRRLALLQGIGIADVMVCPADIDESEKRREAPVAYVLRLAQEKAQKIAAAYPDRYVLGTDTAIALGRRILHKAPDAAGAAKHMEWLSGRRHWVYTGVCLVSPGGRITQRLGKTHVHFKRLSLTEKAAFVASEEWQGVCGYRSQGLASAFITHMTGTPSNVMGLPVYEVGQLLSGAGFPLFSRTVTT